MQSYDVRSVRFIKTTSECPVKKNERADFICLGHFDMMHVDLLSTNTNMPLIEIQNDRDEVKESQFNCPANCVYSLYLFKEVSQQDASEIDAFWRKPDIFTVVTRIHCDFPQQWGGLKVPFSRILEQHCNHLPETEKRISKSVHSVGRCVLEMCCPVNAEDRAKEIVSTLFYDSLELGDTVAIMKSQSIVAILELIRFISNHKVVRDTYSYCGIIKNVLTGDKDNISSMIVKGAALDSITTRCSVRDVHNAALFMRDLTMSLKKNPPQFYVTGTADMIINWKSSSEEDLLQIAWALTNQSDVLHLCFNDVITRIGIAQDLSGQINEKYSSELVVPKLECQYPVILRTKEWLDQEKKCRKLRGWKYTLLKLLGTLEAMYASYVMDDLAELIVPGVTAFLERIEYIRLKYGDEELNDKDDELVNFLNYWTVLTNDIAQLESQLTQHPELSPIRYYIPATILRFEQEFVRDCCSALSVKNGRQFIPMLIPMDITDLATECPLDPRQENYNETCPLLVFIPYKDLYHPWTTALRVTHEMAHYCDNSARNRNTRHVVLRKCAASFVAKYWYSIFFEGRDKDEYGLYHQKTLEYVDILDEYLSNLIDELYPSYPTGTARNNGKGQWYLYQSQWVINDVAGQLLLSNHYREKYIFSLEKQYFFRQENVYNSVMKDSVLPQGLVTQFQKLDQHLDTLAFLCSEAFADIAMVLLLKCSFNDYYSCVYEEEFNRYLATCSNIEVLYGEPKIMRQVVRLSLVIFAVHQTFLHINPSWDISVIAKGIGKQSEFVMSALQLSVGDDKFYSDLLKTGTEEPAGYADMDDIRLIKTYVACCAEELYNSFDIYNSEQRDKIQSVRDALTYVYDEGFDWKQIYHYINRIN